ncbi:unnamed protein product [Miscanthus lutarioriparius]|uniref:Uncharacterized protein n=1 Tax=Miscanthus lutarioriparius TaxID=422564 RepID=A0A811QC08_9POAL|nr:unnamed protein product [Miscanthus lutarioriparius]
MDLAVDGGEAAGGGGEAPGMGVGGVTMVEEGAAAALQGGGVALEGRRGEADASTSSYPGSAETGKGADDHRYGWGGRPAAGAGC